MNHCPPAASSASPSTRISSRISSTFAIIWISLHPSQRITELQAMIANEVAKRIQRIDTQNVTIRKLVLKAIARTYLEGEDKYSVPPIVIA
jgi:hypothetical protein